MNHHELKILKNSISDKIFQNNTISLRSLKLCTRVSNNNRNNRHSCLFNNNESKNNYNLKFFNTYKNKTVGLTENKKFIHNKKANKCIGPPIGYEKYLILNRIKNNSNN
jgi:hypothetical protein